MHGARVTIQTEDFDLSTEIAALRGVSERTVQRDWERARTLLYTALKH